ncbi:metalloregulator ArsR/SmtB family transcription factor [Pseudonocardia halophobica]|uniref:Transcriptional regulator, ArsR family protein n=1 Tax=Pseudonocardia halophobica TaxID=29401 RepID=A0A9W6L493_9PSEU|nr:helix-turn-helix domain-containing protein [Pseudonocardia halophobica]GLL11796.1 putative transcriptional regulator, ArsR family protein [Pseudonocardia halophobica]
MVVRELSPDEVDRIFHGLADATRRDIVEQVLREAQSISTLARRYEMSFAAVQKHVAVLERAALVTKQRRGREQLVHGNPEALQRAARLLEDYERIWRHRVRAIEDILAEDVSSPDIRTQDPEERTGP